MLLSKSCGVKIGCSNSWKTSKRDAKGAAGRQGKAESVSLQDVSVSSIWTRLDDTQKLGTMHCHRSPCHERASDGQDRRNATVPREQPA